MLRTLFRIKAILGGMKVVCLADRLLIIMGATFMESNVCIMRVLTQLVLLAIN